MSCVQNNPVIYDSSNLVQIQFAATKDSLLDTEIYSKFVYSCETNFRKSRFYKAYKSHLMDIGLNRDQDHASITSDMVNLEMHHHFPTLKQATIMIIEHNLLTKGCITTFEVVRELEECHRKNWMGIIMLSETGHQVFEDGSSNQFISLSQCIGDPFQFIDHYIDGMTLDICYKMLLQLKLEEEYDKKSFSPKMMKAKEEITDWSKKIETYM